MGRLPSSIQRRLSQAAKSTKCRKERYLFLRRLNGGLASAVEFTKSIIVQQVVNHIVSIIVECPTGVANIQIQKTGAEAIDSAGILPASDLERSKYRAPSCCLKVLYMKSCHSLVALMRSFGCSRRICPANIFVHQ